MNVGPAGMESQSRLHRHYQALMAPPAAFAEIPWRPEVLTAIREIEDGWNEFETSRIDGASMPRPNESFDAWYRRVYEAHCAAVEVFFAYLAEEASLAELALYIQIEQAVDGRFDDLVALAQLGLPNEAKMCLAENYWDEMGHGDVAQMHTVLFEESAAFLGEVLRECQVRVADFVEREALANSNLLLMYALRRDLCCRLLGAMTILEHTAPARFEKTVAGLRRHGVPESVVFYHELHIGVDAHHGEMLHDKVLRPLAASSPAAMREIALGVLTRFNVALDYYRGLERAFATVRGVRSAG